MTSRSRNYFRNASRTQIASNALGNTTYTQQTFVSKYVIDTLSSDNSPRVNGKLILKSNPLNRMLIDRDDVPFSIRCGINNAYSNLVWSQAFYNITSTSPPNLTGFPPENEDESYRLASNAFYDDIGSLSANFALIFAERQKTIDLIAHNAKRIYELYRSLRRGRNPFRGNSRTRSKDASKLWLEHAYGWTPLLHDIYNVMELGSLDPPAPYRRISRTITRSGNGNEAGKPASYGCDGMLGYKSSKITQQLRTTVKAQIHVANAAHFSSRIGLTNPALITWELVPYSFVVDWFYPVGPWLERQTADLGLTFTNANVTRMCKSYIAFSAFTYISPRLTKYGYYGSGSGNAQEKRLFKTRTLGIPVKVLPKLKNPLSVSHAISALALLRVLFK